MHARCILIVLAILVAWWVADAGGPVTPGVAPEPHPGLACPDPGLAHDTPADTGLLPQARGSLLSASSEVGTESGAEERSGLRVSLVWSETREPADGIQVTIARASRSRAMPAQVVATGTTDSQGLCSFHEIAPGRYGAYSNRGNSKTIDLPAAGIVEIEWEVPRGRERNGRVLDEHGDPVQGASIWFRPRVPNPEILLGQSDETGAFVVRGIHEAGALEARHENHQPSELLQFPLESTPEGQELELVVTGRGSRVEGGVARMDGTPAARAFVQLELEARTPARVPVPGAVTVPTRLASVADENGRFAYSGLPPGRARLRVWLPDSEVYSQSLVLADGCAEQVEIRLEDGAALVGRVLDPRGLPAAGAIVAAGRLGSESFRKAEADAEGRYVLAGIRPGEVALVASLPGVGRIAESMWIVDRGTHVWNPVLCHGAHLRGMVLPRGALSEHEWIVVARDTDPLSAWNSRTATRSGRFEFKDCGGTTVRVQVFDPMGSPLRAVATRDVDPRSGEVTIEFDHDPSNARLGGRLSGRSVAGSRVELEAVGTDLVDSSFPGSDGRFQFDRLASGTYTLAVLDAVGVRTPLGQFELGVGEEVELGDLRLMDAASLRLRRAPEGLGDPVRVAVSAWTPDFRCVATGSLDGREECVLAVAPGPYRIQVEPHGWAIETFGVGLREGEERHVLVRPTPGVPVVVEVERARVPREFLRECLVFEDERGETCASAILSNTSRHSELETHLSPGRYRVRWLRGTIPVETAVFDAGPSGGAVRLLEPGDR